MLPLAGLLLCLLPAADWTQFRGPNSSGIAGEASPPTAFSPQSAAWKTAIPPGKSSPIFAAHRLLLTGHENDQLLTFAIHRDTGALLWKQSVTRARSERRHKLNDPAAPTPVTDGRSVFSFFPDFGLAAYSVDGKPLWTLPLPPMPSMQGVSASPLLTDGKLILIVDQAANSYMLAINPANGETLWRKDRLPAPGGAYSSPVAFRPHEFVTFSPFEIAGFDTRSGEKLWWVSGLPPQPKATPLIHGDTIYAYARSFFGDAVPVIPVFATALAQSDANKDGRISKDEAPDGPAKQFFGVVDRNKDAAIDASEWATMIEVAAPKSTLLAIRPQGRGDLTASAIRWQFQRNIPDVPMPLLYRDSLFMVQNGGILSALNPSTGIPSKQARLTGALGDYYASPIAANGKIFAANQEGKIAVIDASSPWELLHINDLEDEIYATPAALANSLYVRTARSLFRFASVQ